MRAGLVLILGVKLSKPLSGFLEAVDKTKNEEYPGHSCEPVAHAANETDIVISTCPKALSHFIDSCHQQATSSSFSRPQLRF